MSAIEPTWRRSVRLALSHASEVADEVDEGAADLILSEGQKFAALPAPRSESEFDIRQRQLLAFDQRVSVISHAAEVSRECPEMRAEVFDALRQVLNFTYPTTSIQNNAEQCRQAGLLSLIREASNSSGVPLVPSLSTV